MNILKGMGFILMIIAAVASCFIVVELPVVVIRHGFDNVAWLQELAFVSTIWTLCLAYLGWIVAMLFE